MAFPVELSTLVKPTKLIGTPFNIDPVVSEKQLQVLDILVDGRENSGFKYHPATAVQNLVERFVNGNQVSHWQRGSDLNNWNQSLNFAVWCATTGCGIGADLLFDSKGVSTSESRFTASLLRFHVYYTVRRLLYELGVSLPTSASFDLKNVGYSVIAHKKLVIEFNPPQGENTDFRFHGGDNNGLGTINIFYTYQGPHPYPGEVYGHGYGFGPTTNNNTQVYYIEQNAPDQFKHFIPRKCTGLTKAGVVRINQSLEAFCYCVLTAQTTIRHSIVGIAGLEAQARFAQLVEQVITRADPSTLVARFQNSLQKARRKLDFALSPFLRLVPSNLDVRVEELFIQGYNNQIKDGSAPGVHFGFNQQINRSADQLMRTSVVSVSVSEKQQQKQAPHGSVVSEKHATTFVIAAAIAGIAIYGFQRKRLLG